MLTDDYFYKKEKDVDNKQDGYAGGTRETHGGR